MHAVGERGKDGSTDTRSVGARTVATPGGIQQDPTDLASVENRFFRPVPRLTPKSPSNPHRADAGYTPAP